METDIFKRPVRVLHLEDNEKDRFLVAELFRVNRLMGEVFPVKSHEEFAAALKSARYDLIISDFTLPSYDGASALSLARELQPEIPFIFFSGTIGEEVAVESLKNGATDYVLKQRPARLVAAVRNALRNAQERARRRHAEKKIREQAELLDMTRDAIIFCDMEPRVLFWNKGAERIYGWTAAEAVGQLLNQLLFRGNPPPQVKEAAKSLEERGEWMGELREFTKDGRTVVVQGRSTLIRDERGQPKSLLIINTDITEQKHLQEQFLRAQRLESLGALVSGIAHDLNNSLVPLLIGVQILRERNASPDTESILHTMETSVRRGAEMVKQVLAFARGGESEAVIIYPNQLVKEISKIIADTFPKSIQCRVRADENAWTISGVPTQLHQVLMNLCVNARDAMLKGGTLTLAVENVTLQPDDVAAHQGVKTGDYVCVTVADTGGGVPADQLEKIFEPFFTTKGPTKGTGLGLSTSRSIIQNHGGFMTVTSAAGRGSEFKFFLPVAVTGRAEAEREKLPPPSDAGECILVVDDEEGILAMMRAALESYGYDVLTAAGGSEAVTRFTENSNAIHLVISDLGMPLMDGFATAAALRQIRPDIKIVIASGAGEEIKDSGHPVKIDGFLDKPFTRERLLETVYQTLAKNAR
jgi:PAS domain S-box-containing protein